MDTKMIINQRLKESALPEEQLSLWAGVMETLSESALKDILNFIETRADGVTILTASLIAKESALEKGDLEQWENTMENDVSVIHSL